MLRKELHGVSACREPEFSNEWSGPQYPVHLWREVSIQTFPLLGRQLSHSVDPFANLVFETRMESTVFLSYMYNIVCTPLPHLRLPLLMIVKKCRGIVITHPIMDHPTRILCIIFTGEGNYQNPTAFPLTLVYPSVEYSCHSFRWIGGVLLRLHLFVIAKAYSVEILLDRVLKLY